MTALSIFWFLIITGSVICGINIFYSVSGFKPLKNVFSYFLKFGYAALMFALTVFILGSILPYMLNARDSARIQAYTDNISLYNRYVEEYRLAAQQQIEQYQKMQAEMARVATSTQLQYWAQQTDAVGNSLTNQIKEFKNSIMQQELEINKMKAQINSRHNNKWFFWI
jgi:hypothetical protein